MQIIQLIKNMRLEEGSQDYAELLDKIGRADPSIHDGMNIQIIRIFTYAIDEIYFLHVTILIKTLDRSCAIIPKELMAETEDDVINWIYGKGDLRVEDADGIKDSCILTPLNDASLEINHKVRMFNNQSFFIFLTTFSA
jgi:hypothetical protein